MAFGITRDELKAWQKKASAGDIAIITHYWTDPRFPTATSVTKVGSSDIKKLKAWGKQYGLNEHWIDYHAEYPHYDLFAPFQQLVLEQEDKQDQIRRFLN